MIAPAAVDPRDASRPLALGAVLDRPTIDVGLAGPPAQGEEPELVYQGTRVREPGVGRLAATVEVIVISADGVGPLQHYPFHNPVGFDWGYLGHGPADLARCILLHHLGIEPECVGALYPPSEEELPVSYHEFLSEVIAPLPRCLQWFLTRDQVAAWVASHR